MLSGRKEAKREVISMYCKNCGKELLPGHAFCGACGTPAPKAGPQNTDVKFGDDFAPKPPTYTPPTPQWQAPPKSAKKKDWKIPVIIGLCAVLVVLLVIAAVFVVDFLRPEPMIDPSPPETITTLLIDYIPIQNKKYI